MTRNYTALNKLCVFEFHENNLQMLYKNNNYFDIQIKNSQFYNKIIKYVFKIMLI